MIYENAYDKFAVEIQRSKKSPAVFGNCGLVC